MPPWRVAIFGRGQNSDNVKDISDWYHEFPKGYPGAPNYDLAILKEFKNEGKVTVQLAVPEGIRWLEGKAASQSGYQCGFKPGGATQIFIPREIAKILFVEGKSFFANPNKSSYKAFVKACKPAYELQKKWMAEFAEAKVTRAELEVKKQRDAVLLEANKKLAEAEEKKRAADAEKILQTEKNHENTVRESINEIFKAVSAHCSAQYQITFYLLSEYLEIVSTIKLIEKLQNKELGNEFMRQAKKLKTDIERILVMQRARDPKRFEEAVISFFANNATKASKFANLPADIRAFFSGEKPESVPLSEAPDIRARRFVVDDKTFCGIVVEILVTFLRTERVSETHVIHWYKITHIVRQ